MTTVRFRTKTREMWYVGEETPAYTYVQVPKLTRNHCDMAEMRKSKRFGHYANSDLFIGLLNRCVRELGIQDRIRLDSLPPCVTVNTSGFLAEVTIAIPDN